MATEGYVIVDRMEKFDTIEADLKTKYTWTTVSETHLVKFGGVVIAYAKGS
jgi:hypothetical protein